MPIDFKLSTSRISDNADQLLIYGFLKWCDKLFKNPVVYLDDVDVIEESESNQYDIVLNYPPEIEVTLSALKLMESYALAKIKDIREIRSQKKDGKVYIHVIWIKGIFIPISSTMSDNNNINNNNTTLSDRNVDEQSMKKRRHPNPNPSEGRKEIRDVDKE